MTKYRKQCNDLPSSNGKCEKTKQKLFEWKFITSVVTFQTVTTSEPKWESESWKFCYSSFWLLAWFWFWVTTNWPSAFWSSMAATAKRTKPPSSSISRDFQGEVSPLTRRTFLKKKLLRFSMKTQRNLFTTGVNYNNLKTRRFNVIKNPVGCFLNSFPKFLVDGPRKKKLQRRCHLFLIWFHF